MARSANSRRPCSFFGAPRDFTKPESPADVFSLRYGDFLEIADDEAGWEVWTKVVARRDIEERLMRPWTARAHKASDGP